MAMSTYGTDGPSNQDLERDILTIGRSKGRSILVDWEMALDEDAIREAMKDAMPADAPSRARARL